LTFFGIAQFQCHGLVEALVAFGKCEGQSQSVLRFNIGRCQEELNHFIEARALYKSLQAEFPRFPEPLFRLSPLAFRDTRPHDVNPEAKQYRQMIIEEIDQNNVQALLELGSVAARAGQLREARQLGIIFWTVRKQKQIQGNGQIGLMVPNLASLRGSKRTMVVYSLQMEWHYARFSWTISAKRKRGTSS
jgi:hypothetical protein